MPIKTWQHRDGELRIYEHGYSGGVTNYIEILFTDANLTGPLGRMQTDERIVLDRGVLDTNSHRVQGTDYERCEPLPLTFSCKVADDTQSQILVQMMSGVTTVRVGGTTYGMYTRSGVGETDMYGFTTTPPAFNDSTYKCAYMVECLWSGTSDWGMRWDEVWFPPNEQTITESEEAVTFNINGRVYGGVTKITAFHTNAGVSAMPR